MTKYDVGSLPYELQKIALGACFLGSGGGGKLKTSLDYIDDFFSKNEIIQNFQLTDLITDLGNVTARQTGIVVAYMGAPQKMDKIKCPDAVCKGIEKFENDIKKNDSNFSIDYIIPVEIGPVSTITACLTALQLGKKVLNVDGAGRAVPTLDLITYTTNAHVSVNPTFLCSENENENKNPPEDPVYHQIKLEIFGDKKPDAEYSEDMDPGAASKMESLARPVLNMPEFDQKAGLVMWYFEDVIKLMDDHASVKGTLTFCHKLGGAIRSKLKDEDGLPDIEELFADIKELFNEQPMFKELPIYPDPAIEERCRGVLKSATTLTAGGFDVGVITIKDDRVKGDPEHLYKIIFQNESLLLWDSDSPIPLVMAPDLISYLIDEEPYTYTNGDIMENGALKNGLNGKNIVVYGIAAPRALTESESNMMNKRKDILCNAIAGAEPNALPKHYMSILNNIGYYGSYVKLEK